MIEVKELSKRYGTFEAVKQISFSVNEGDVVGLLGPNGAGKTTTMRMLTTFLPPTSGTATIGGLDIQRSPHEIRKNLGYLPEHPPLYPEMRVKDYLQFVANLKGMPRGQITNAVDEALTNCSLRGVSSKLCSQLSKGYRQRVGLAQALVHKPKVIILDEPTSGLDPAQIIEMRKFIADLKGKHTVILSTHILSEVLGTCNTVIIIAGGKVVTQGSLIELTKEKSLEQRFLDAVAEDGGAPTIFSDSISGGAAAH